MNQDIFATSYTEILMLKREIAELENHVQLLTAKNQELLKLVKHSPKNSGCGCANPRFDVL